MLVHTPGRDLGKERHIILPQEIKTLVGGEWTAAAIDLVVVPPVLGLWGGGHGT